MVSSGQGGKVARADKQWHEQEATRGGRGAAGLCYGIAFFLGGLVDYCAAGRCRLTRAEERLRTHRLQKKEPALRPWGAFWLAPGLPRLETWTERRGDAGAAGCFSATPAESSPRGTRFGTEARDMAARRGYCRRIRAQRQTRCAVSAAGGAAQQIGGDGAVLKLDQCSAVAGRITGTHNIAQSRR